MPLTPGTRLGPYEIVSPLGAGGMGEVYRARDTKLGREVALKLLPESFTHDPERVGRFRREAQVLASLNHPHIAHIHGFEDSTGMPALVMELVEGPTLADRIAQGPLPLDEALSIARQIADALEAAHEQGIVHRDLKPANIKVRADGTAKVLDFGLAKVFDPTDAVGASASNSPTFSIHATQAGIILGTAAYMAPEQARGKSVDRRADIWAFGCVLYEMLTGHRPFDADDVSMTLAAVMMKEPNWAVLPGDTPIGVRRLLTGCLKKDPRERLRDIGDARPDLGEFLTGSTESGTAVPALPARPSWRPVLLMTVVACITASVTGAIVWFAAHRTLHSPSPSRLSIILPSTAALAINGVSRDIAITPDGSRLIYVGANGRMLFVRPLDQLEVTPLASGDALRDPFVSPNGQWVGFFDGAITLKKVALTGGPAVVVAQVDGAERGATWMPDDTIIFATTSVSGLQRISADGGAPTVLTQPDRMRAETHHWWPEQLPGGQAVLCTVELRTGGPDTASIAVVDLRSGQLTKLFQGGSHAHYVSSGHLVYMAAGTVRAVGFNPRRLSVIGTARPVTSQLRSTPMGAVDVVVAEDGTLIYVAGGVGSESARTLVWVDRQGRETPLAAPSRAYSTPRISPDGTRVALVVSGEQKPDIWLWNLASSNLTPVSLGPFSHLNPIWTLNGRIVLSSDREGGALNLFSQAADGSGVLERLGQSAFAQVASSVSPDGSRLIFTGKSAETGQDVMALKLDGEHQVFPLVNGPFEERNGIVSPDGRWLAYEANDSGAFEIHVRPFPAVGTGHWQVSTNGGSGPLWAHSGKELFFVAADNTLMQVAVESGPTWTAGPPTKVLEARYVLLRLGGNIQRNYDVTADGQRFLVIKTPAGDSTVAPAQIVVVQHFDEELRRLVPAK